MWPLLTALVVGGMISDDRKNGTSAIYFSRPVTRADYTAMKYLSSAVVLGFVIVFSYMLYYTSAIVFNGEGLGLPNRYTSNILRRINRRHSIGYYLHFNRHGSIKR